MKAVFAIIAIFSALNSFAYSGPRIIMASEKPGVFKCEIYSDKVVITRKIGEMQFTKTNNVKVDGLDTVIEKAYIKGPMVAQNSEYTAVHLTRNANTNEVETRVFNFTYNDSDFANDMIYLTSSLCENRF